MGNSAKYIFSGILLMTVLGFYLARDITIETDLTGYSLASEKELNRYNKIQEAFAVPGSSQSVVIIENKLGWSSLASFQLLDSLMRVWKTYEEVESVAAIINVLYPRQAVMVVKKRPFLNLNNQEAFDKRYKDWEAYADITRKFISEDKKYALLFISTQSGQGLSQKSIERFSSLDILSADIEVHFLQNQLINKEVQRLTRKDSVQLALISTVLILIAFFILTKSLQGLVLIALMVGFNLACTLMFMLAIGIPFTIHMITVPCIVIVLSFTDIMHILYHQRVLAREQLEPRVFYQRLIKAVQLPMLMTSLTNVIGFLVFLLLSENAYLFNFSLVSIAGVGIAFLSTRFLFIHALSHTKSIMKRASFAKLNQVHDKLTRGTKTNAGRVFSVLSLLSIIAVYLAVSQFRIDSSEGKLMSKESALTKAGEILNQHFFGDKQAEVIIRSDEPLWSIKALSVIDSLEQQIEQIFTPTYLESPALVVRRYRRFQRNGHPRAFSLPLQVTSFLREDLNRYADNFGGVGILSADKKVGKISFGYRNNGLEESRAQYQQLETLLQLYEGKGLSFELTGRSYLGDRGTYAFTIKIIIGLIVGVLAASLLTVLFLSSVRKSLILIFVNLFPIVVVLVIMLLTGIAITPLTLFFLSLLAGICVDDSIYIVAQQGKRGEAVHIFPIVVTSTVLAAGFVALGFSNFEWVRPFSWVFLVGIVLALVMDLLVLPVFLGKGNRK